MYNSYSESEALRYPFFFLTNLLNLCTDPLLNYSNRLFFLIVTIPFYMGDDQRFTF